MAQIITPSNAVNNVQFNEVTQGLQVGPIPVQWLGNSNQAVIDLTAVVKTSNISVKSMLIDNSNCMVSVIVQDPTGNVSNVPPGYFGYFPVSWLPGGQFTLTVANVLSGSPTITPENALSQVPTITNISFMNWRVEPLLVKGQRLKYKIQGAGGATYNICDNIGHFNESASINFAGGIAAIFNDTIGSPAGCPMKFSNLDISLNLTTQPTASFTGTFLLTPYGGGTTFSKGFSVSPGQYNVPLNIDENFAITSYQSAAPFLGYSITSLNPGSESAAGTIVNGGNFELVI